MDGRFYLGVVMDETEVVDMEMLPVKAIMVDDTWQLDVLGVPFDSRDSDNQYFAYDTKFHLDKYPPPPVVYYHGFNDSKRPDAQPQYIGKAIKQEVKQDGIWYRVVLDKSNALAARVWEAAKKGVARASSGSIAHLARYARDGKILEWPVVELSVFETDTGKSPANRYAVAVPVYKAWLAQEDINLPDDITLDEPAEPAEAEGVAAVTQSVEGATKAQVNNEPENVDTRSIKMEPNEVQALVADAVTNALKMERDASAAKAAEEAAIQKRIDEAVAAVKTADAASNRLPYKEGEAPYATKFAQLHKYDDLEPDDKAVLAGVLSAIKMKQRGSGPSEDLLKALAIDMAESKDDNHKVAQNAMKAAGMAMKANELNQSTLATYGDEWVGITYSTALWEKIRLATQIVGKIPTIIVPQGSESVIIPLESTAPTFYTVAQASAQSANPGVITNTITTSKMGTAKQTLTVAKLGAAVNWTGELDEDSLIPWAAELRRSLVSEAAEVLEHIVIDGDTATENVTNINDIGGQPAGTEAFMLFNGFRKLALVTNTANSRDNGALTVEDYLETVKLLGLAGRNAIDKAQVGIIIDMWTHWKTLTLTEVKTRDVFVAPTIEGGNITSLFGYNIMASANMHRANQDATYGLKVNTAGKVNLDTASANTTGAILAVRWDQWRLGMKRRMTFEMDRTALADANTIVVQMRVGMINRDNEASAISYNVGL